MVRKLLKWAGSKTRLIETLLLSMPVMVSGKYFEPFAGSAALYFNRAITSEHVGMPLIGAGAVLSDINLPLMNFFWAVKYRVADLMTAVDTLEFDFKGKNNSDKNRMYSDIRKLFNTTTTVLGDVEQAARFLFLIRTCYCGLYRVSRIGAFNTSFNHKASGILQDPQTMLECSRALNLADIRCCDYESALRTAVCGDFAYLDPPYDNCFTGYTLQGFDSAEQERLLVVCNMLNDRGVLFLMSQSDTALIRDLYRNYYIQPIAVPRLIGRRHAAANQANELLISNYDYAAVQMHLPCESRMPVANYTADNADSYRNYERNVIASADPGYQHLHVATHPK